MAPSSNPWRTLNRGLLLAPLVALGPGASPAPASPYSDINAAAKAGSIIVHPLRGNLATGFPHGIPTTEAETVNADLLAFIEG